MVASLALSLLPEELSKPHLIHTNSRMAEGFIILTFLPLMTSEIPKGFGNPTLRTGTMTKALAYCKS